MAESSTPNKTVTIALCHTICGTADNDKLFGMFVEKVISGVSLLNDIVSLFTWEESHIDVFSLFHRLFKK